MGERSPRGVLVIADGRTIRLRSPEALSHITRAISAEHAATAPRCGDAHVARALTALAGDPARRWTVATIAKAAGLSRAAFARRFARETGKTPLAHLAELRMRIAAGALVATDDALAVIAARVGYASEFAFAKAFKRHLGVPPGTYRRSAAGRTDHVRAAA